MKLDRNATLLLLSTIIVCITLIVCVYMHGRMNRLQLVGTGDGGAYLLDRATGEISLLRGGAIGPVDRKTNWVP